METASLTFGAPQWLWLLGILPLVAGAFAWSHRRNRALLAKIVAPRLREQLAGSVSPFRRAARAVLLLGAFAFAILALAQPRLGFIERETKQKGRDVIVAVDTSRSMLATDVSPTRLARAKLFTQDLVRLLGGDRVGLVAFAGSAFLQAPLTLDQNAIINSLGELDTTVIPKGGTNIAAAIATAREAFGKAEGNTRALVILTDGEELAADGIAAAKQAEAEGIRIFTVGIGSPEGSLIPIRTEDGRPDFVRDEAGNPVTSKLDGARLSEIAAATGGFYLPIGPEAAREVFQKGIEPIELAETGVFSARQPIERFQWPLAAATLCLALSLLPGDRRRRSAKAAAALLLALSPSAQAQSGLDDYGKGDFQKAGAEFQKQLQSRPGSRELQFNAGAAAYKSGDFEAAVKNFTDALLSEDKGLRAKSSYNLANSLVRKGEAAQDPEAKKTNWKNAIEHYGETLEIEPDNKNAEENRDLVKKLLEELEKQQQQQQQQQNQQQQDQKKDEQQKQDQKQDQQKQDGSDKKDEQQKQEQEQDKKDGGQESKPEEKKEGEPKGESGNQNQQDQKKSEGAPTPTPEPAPTPGEKKEGELKGGDGNQPTPTPAPAGQQQEAPAAAEEEKEGQISPTQARALLNSLRGEEEKVNLMEAQPASQEVLKDW
ncbi:MAG: VWA domain-containing protein [Verrucomicrobia bacterium]|nr:VWA domain-containing protein [Verrucomicrobiota bacterium]